VLGTVTLLWNGNPVALTAVGSISFGGDLFSDPLFGGDADGVTTGVALDYTNGIITWHDSPRPAPGDTLIWSGEFDVPARLNTDSPQFIITPGNNYSLQSLPIVELR
jgi:hypothetical protein